MNEMKVLVVEDESAKHAGHQGAKESGGGHYNVLIVSEAFAGRGRVARHKMVFEALTGEEGETMTAKGIHALALSLHTPEEWQSIRQ